MNKPCIHAGEEMANILLVDDNKADIELMRYEIGEERKISCNITIANSGASALNQCAQPAIGNNRVDLVVLDINMPGMDGFEFLKNFRQNADNNSIPVVMCSTSTYDKDIWQAKQLGACGYMTKPFRFVELESIIKDLPYISLRQSTQGLTLMRHGDQTKCPVFSAH
jgi:CheY-like chemotaxis protein